MSRDVLTVGSTMRIPLLYRDMVITSCLTAGRGKKIERLIVLEDLSFGFKGFQMTSFSLIDCNDICLKIYGYALERQDACSVLGEQDRKLQFYMSMRLSKLLKENNCLILIFVTYK
ncbi:hypothetical protein Tco_0977205 [Tanacetum coccineum]|uniref:Uncharacterized protein n=1 Tax=Tanacetum coccineum TaxID=301880 RepID=A0ABQ5EJG2_9ASTR